MCFQESLSSMLRASFHFQFISFQKLMKLLLRYFLADLQPSHPSFWHKSIMQSLFHCYSNYYYNYYYKLLKCCFYCLTFLGEINVHSIKSGYRDSTAVCPGLFVNFTFTRTNATNTSINFYSSVNLQLEDPIRGYINDCHYTDENPNLIQPNKKYVKSGFCFIEIGYLIDTTKMIFNLIVVDDNDSPMISKKFHKQIDFTGKLISSFTWY